MNLKDKMQKFNQRWNIKDIETPEENFKKFKTRILNILKNIDENITTESVTSFCQFYGIEEKWNGYGINTWSNNIINRLISENNEIEFYKIIEVIFSLDMPGSFGYNSMEYDKNTIYQKVCQAIELSNIDLATTVIKDSDIIFYPKGEEKLDRDLVNSALTFLDEKSNHHFVDGLKFYSDKNWIKSAESLRRSLEEFLRFKLKNNNGLKVNTAEITKKLKDENSPAQARNIIVKIFDYIDQYFNENSKHKDGDLKENEAEFLIYQIALLMRYIDKQIL